jgi:hypothetical protein
VEGDVSGGAHTQNIEKIGHIALPELNYATPDIRNDAKNDALV